MTTRPAMFAGATPSRMARGAIAPVIAAFLSACGGAPELEEDAASAAAAPGYASAYPSSSGLAFEEEEGRDREPFDEDAARDEAEDEIAGETYVSIGTPYGCTDDCSGHEAGFRYRADNGYAGHNADSPSFNEGGQAFDEAVEERVDEMREEYESGGEARD